MTYQKFCTGHQGAVRNDAVEMRGGRGFSLIEFMVGSLVVLVTMAAAFSVLGKYQKSYQGEQLAADLHQGVRSAMELLSQEIGQAGYLGSSARQVQAPIAGNTAGQTVAISSTDSIFAGETLVVDAGAAQERVAVTGVDGSNNTVTGIFRNSHNANAPVSTLGTFPQGVMPAPTSTATRLGMFGDINGDGSLVYVEYNYNLGLGTLTRSITPISAACQNPPLVLVRNIVANPGGTACFRYKTQALNGLTYVFEVSVTLSTRSTDLDPETKQYRTMTSSLILAPRNVQAAYGLAVIPATERLQPTPPGVPLLPCP
jgi:type II secretory pathway pseudopilin PulG